MRYYAKKREERDLFNAVQWNGELTSDVLELLGKRQFFVDGRLLILENDRTVRSGDWICVIGKEISAVTRSDVFSSTCEEVDESGRPLPLPLPKTAAEQAASVADFVGELDALLLTGLKLTSVDHLGIFEERVRLKRKLFRLLEDQACTAATSERHRRAQDWIFTIRHWSDRDEETRSKSVVGPACASTVEAAFHLANLAEGLRTEIRTDLMLRRFVDGLLDHDANGYYVQPRYSPHASARWVVCIGPVHAVVR